MDVHAQFNSSVSNLDADSAQTNHAQRTAWQFKTNEFLFAVFDCLMHGMVVAVELFDEIQRLRNVSCGQQHAGQHEFFNSISVGAGSVEHWHAALRHLCNWNVVGACACTADGLDRRVDFDLVHVSRANQHGIRIGDFRGDFVAVTRQALEAEHRDIVEGLNLEHA